MPKLPVVKPKQLIKLLHKLGFQEIRQKGSHKFFYRRSDKKSTLVPYHSKDLGKGILKKILNEINLSVEEFIKLLKK